MGVKGRDTYEFEAKFGGLGSLDCNEAFRYSRGCSRKVAGFAYQDGEYLLLDNFCLGST